MNSTPNTHLIPQSLAEPGSIPSPLRGERVRVRGVRLPTTERLNTHFNFDMNRRDFFGRFALGLGGVALTGLLQRTVAAPNISNPFTGVLSSPHVAPRARRIIYLFMSGGPSQLDLFDYKPTLNKMNGDDLPESIRMGQRLTGMSGNQATLPLAGSIFKFAQHGQAGAWVSELMPWTAKMVDELCIVKSLHTEAINHDPAITFFQTG